jgi:hypothetical protein
MKKYLFLLFIMNSLNLCSFNAFGWGNRGHSLICESAIHLVKNEELKNFLLSRTLALSYLCNIPDTFWRQPEFSKTGDSTHFIDSDLAGVTLNEVPVVYSEFVNKFKNKTRITNKAPIFSVAKEVGTSWWRAEQFVLRAITNGKKAKSLALPSKGEEKSDEHPFNKEVFNMLINMGVLGHFVGDNAQPMHTTVNYDGWANGHGGLHSYYEEIVVNQLSTNLLDQVTESAKNIEKDLNLDIIASIPEKMKQLSILSHNDFELLMKLDPVLEPSILKTDKGMELRTPAKRKSPKEGAKIFEKLIIKHMSRSAVLLAHFWDQIYQDSGKPNLEVAKFYKFPHTPDFVKPDYTGE